MIMMIIIFVSTILTQTLYRGFTARDLAEQQAAAAAAAAGRRLYDDDVAQGFVDTAKVLQLHDAALADFAVSAAPSNPASSSDSDDNSSDAPISRGAIEIGMAKAADTAAKKHKS
jgi:hypothetical protein